MNRSVEKWALVAMLLAALGLLVGEVLDQDWVRAAAWAVALIAVAAALLRRRRQPPA